MNRLRAWIRSYFGFSRTETNAFILMLPLMAVLVFSEPAYRWWISRLPEPSGDSALLDSLIATWTWEKPADPAATRRLFHFDPNAVSTSELMELGMTEKIALRVVNYRKKGGQFRVRSDLARIYGMDSLLLSELEPYIDLPEKLPARHTLSGIVREKREAARFDINTADSTQLMEINGIGPRLSARIIKYRRRLGGFVALEQLKEVYGLDSTVLGTLNKRSYIDSGFLPRRIQINSADEKELCTLPYIQFRLAKAIAAYRFQYGDFQSIDELKNIALIDSISFEKIKPYITIKE